VFDRYRDPPNHSLMTREAGEQPVLDVRPKRIGDDGVFARQQDAHIAIQANGAPTITS
jgi:hypothetical protein